MRDGSDAIADWPILNALAQRRGGRDLGQRPPRRWGRDRQLDPRGHGRRRRRDRRCRRAARARAHDRSRARASCATPTRATRRRSTAAREHGLDLPSIPCASVSRRAAPSRLLIRDLAQVATPAGRSAPLRGDGAGRARRRSRTRTSSARTVAIAAVGRDARAPPLAGDVVEVDGRGLSAVPGLVDCHTHACFAGDRVEEFALRAAGATLRGAARAGGGILSTVRATRAAGEEGLRHALARHRGWMLARGHDDVRGEVGIRARSRDRARAAAGDRDGGGVPTWLGAHAVPPEFGARVPTRTSTSCSPRSFPKRRRSLSRSL